MKGYHILLGEDEPDILEYNREQLEQRGYQVTAVSTLGQAESCVLRDNPDLLVLDVMMPDGSGVDLCRRLREQFQGPILFLTSLGESSQIVQGLRAGGDDYITKPFGLGELRARVAAHLRRENRERKHVITLGELSFSLNSRQVFFQGAEIPFTKSEYAICEYLALNRGQVFSKERIYEHVFGYDGEGDSSAITEHIKNIRAKLQKYGVSPVETVWGIGYKWK